MKVFVGRYVAREGTGTALQNNSAATVVRTTTRNWDDINRNFQPDCDLQNPALNGECGPIANQNFGRPVPDSSYSPDVLHGWGVRPSSGELSAALQHQLGRNFGPTVGYFRTWHGNFTVTDTLLLRRRISISTA
jgi:hypothetical protein